MADDDTDILNEVLAERARQDHKWGGPEHDDTHAESAWFMYIGMQVGKCANGQLTRRQALVRIAALCFAAIASIDRKARNNAQELFNGHAVGDGPT